MTPALTASPAASRTRTPFSWGTIGWVSILLIACYAPILKALVSLWNNDPDMGHGFFAPVVAGWIAWKKRAQFADRAAEPNGWGLAIMLSVGLPLYIAIR